MELPTLLACSTVERRGDAGEVKVTNRFDESLQRDASCVAHAFLNRSVMTGRSCEILLPTQIDGYRRD